MCVFFFFPVWPGVWQCMDVGSHPSHPQPWLSSWSVHLRLRSRQVGMEMATLLCHSNTTRACTERILHVSWETSMHVKFRKITHDICTYLISPQYSLSCMKKLSCSQWVWKDLSGHADSWSSDRAVVGQMGFAGWCAPSPGDPVITHWWKVNDFSC